jgi:hypothetical protein
MSDLTSGYTRPAADNIGGVDEVVFFQLEHKATGAAVTDGEVTTLELENGTQAFRYFLEEDLSTYTDDLTGTDGNGTIMSAQTLTMILNDNRKATRNEVMNLATNWLVACVKTSQGTWKVLGWDYGLKLRTDNSTPGTAKADRNGMTITMDGQQKGLAYDISSAIVDSLLVVAS